jgi:co-chaperonin GroES (HSP10)
MLVRVEIDEQKGLIYIPEGTNLKDKPPVEGTLIAIGDDMMKPWKCGDRVVFGLYAGHVIPHEKNIYVISEGDIWYLVEGAKPETTPEGARRRTF